MGRGEQRNKGDEARDVFRREVVCVCVQKICLCEWVLQVMYVTKGLCLCVRERERQSEESDQFPDACVYRFMIGRRGHVKLTRLGHSGSTYNRRDENG